MRTILKNCLLLSLLGVVLPTHISGQSLDVSPCYTFIAEGLNNRMVFAGPEIVVGYKSTWKQASYTLDYMAGFGGGAVFNRGIMGLSGQATPLDVRMRFPIASSRSVHFEAGLRASAIYHLQLYPDLQSGHDFWLTQFSLSPVISMRLGDTECALSFAALSLISRTPELRDPHSFSLRAVDVLSDLHSHLHVADPTLFNAVSLGITTPIGAPGGISLGYALEYLSYSGRPTLHLLTHRLNLSFAIHGDNK